ncbi:MAG: undecaprenyldiphospho-muramoylpentapeptide beta-N-acetylglucosaminyltransferase [Luteitalea sp.]|nr:undecaprenyldiphospho-muramoylpentapeptide beta-N-acetylglucosaminyltransferase [Luteitalea sp.]
MEDSRESPTEAARVVVAGGGTGGHLYPGIAVAREWLRRRRDARITFVGTARGLEARIVPREGFELDTIRSAGLMGQTAGAFIRGLALLPLSVLDAWRVLRARAPDLVIGVGGYSSGPVVLLASWRGVPTMLLEQNAVPGWTNRLLAHTVRAAALSFEQSLPYFPGRGFVSGNPVRAEFLGVSERPPVSGSRRVLVFGGSQGARAINEAMVEAAPYLARVGERTSIVHQTGQRDFETVTEAYRRAGLEARVERYLDDMPREMEAAHLLVCRAGATTIAEIAAAGRAAVLIPFARATDEHQLRNARALQQEGAADVIEESALSGEALAARIAELIADERRRESMAQAARSLARADAAKVIVDRALELVGRREGARG